MTHRNYLRGLFCLVLCMALLCLDAKEAQTVTKNILRRLTVQPSSMLGAKLGHYGMNAWVFEVCDGYDEWNLPFILYTPGRTQKPRHGFPLVLYFGGTGETGNGVADLARLFNSRTIFDIVTSTKFQKAHPCYLLAPLIRDPRAFRCAYPERPSNQARQVKETLFAVVQSLNKGSVDTNRLYTTGLSFGGCAAFEMASSYPSVFAATIPVAATESDFMIPTSHKMDVWWIENNIEIGGEWRSLYLRFKEKIEAGGGEFRFSAYPSKKHNAWDTAWSEEGVWRWLFGKTCDGVSVNRIDVGGKARKRDLPDISWAKCSSNATPVDKSHSAKYGADNLEKTYYMTNDAKSGTWWKMEFEGGWLGYVTVLTGSREGEGALSQGVLEASSDDVKWDRIGNIAKRDGTARGFIKTKHKFLRLRVTDARAKVFIVRDLRFSHK